MAFTNTKGRYASFGVVSCLPGEIIDTFWYIIDNNLKGVFPLEHLLHFELINNHGQLTFRFSERNLPIIISFDFPYPFDPFYPRKVLVVDNHGRETIMLVDEHDMM